MIWSSILVVIMGYLLGSFPSAYIAGRLLKGVDIRQLGDGNMGAANAWRVLGARAGVAVATIDIGKGAAAILIARAIGVPLPVVLLTGVTAVAGHNWPFLLKFRGGRGEASAIGVLSTMLPYEMLILLGVASIPFAITRNVIITPAFLFSPLPLVAWWFGESGALIAYSIALPCLVGFTHFITTRHAPAKVNERGNK
jgi:glycerol-3-phosphate acyltransferase PlsY